MIIGIFDSGEGGKTVMSEIKKLLPNEKYIYFGDSKNCPYGTKPLDELKKIVSENTEYLLARGAELIVVACNTATTQTIDFLRTTFPEIPFVGTEPAVKKACDESSDTARIVLLATEGTAKAARTHELVSLNKKPGQTVEILACPGLARAIEDKNSEKIEEILSEICSALQSSEKQGSRTIETVILGCTHYPLIRDQIQTKFPRAKLVDGGEGVAKEVKRIIESRASQAYNK
ncbi:glutamate racemase [Candidatus Saccharibacteria bacterium]|nr:glutamate racemase [Candidatus Saccharibacteria bacterium]